MNPVALFLLVLAVGFGVGWLILGGLNIFWLLGLACVLASLFIQCRWAER